LIATLSQLSNKMKKLLLLLACLLSLTSCEQESKFQPGDYVRIKDSDCVGIILDYYPYNSDYSRYKYGVQYVDSFGNPQFNRFPVTVLEKAK